MAATNKTPAQTPQKKKRILAEFKEFISRGSVIDLAVGMVVGAAFTAIVTSLVNDIVMPVLGIIVGGLDFSSLKWEMAPGVYLQWGNFINAIINFLAISFVVFMAIKAINSVRAKLRKQEETDLAAQAQEEHAPTELELLTEIRDALVDSE